MNELSRRRHLVRRMAQAAALLMLATILLSAYMRLSQAGVGCEPWPECYAQAARGRVPMEAGDGVAFARLGHRIVASLVLVLAIAMVLSCALSRPRLPREGRLAAGVLGLALGLAVLGVATPGARLPAVALGNLLGGFLMLALCARLAAPVDEVRARGLGRWALVAAAVVVVQVASGALVSASHSAAACTGLADCRAAAEAAGWPWSTLNPWQLPQLDGGPRVHAAGALVRIVHGVGAGLVLAVLAWVAGTAWRHGRKAAGGALAALAGLQVVVGLAVGAGAPPLALVLLHNLLAALSLALLVRLA